MGERIRRACAYMRALLREQFLYLVFGVLTTAVNYAVFVVLRAHRENWPVLVVNLIAFVAAVVFAYVTNKQFVFQRRDWRLSVVFREACAFTAARVFSFLFEEAGLFFASDILRLERYTAFHMDGVLIAKLILNVLVVVMNYFFSKLLVFRKPDD